MNKRMLAGLSVAALGLAGLSNSVYAVGPAIDPANHSNWKENAYYNGFGGALPSGIVEGSAGFSTIGDYSGRTLATATPDITTNNLDGSPLTTITTGLFGGTDVNLYEIAITNVSGFTASIPSTTLILSLFDANGAALGAVVGGGPGNVLTSSVGITSPGLYWIGISNPNQFPQNAAGQNILNITPSVAGQYSPAVGITDTTLATDPHTAWALPLSTSPLLSNTSFTAAGSTITLTGAGFAAVPEPTSLGLIGCAAFGLLSRRRKVAR